MMPLRGAAIAFLLALILASLFASRLAPAPYDRQFRDIPDASPSTRHLLGTDDLGRDRFSRLLVGTRVSLFLAPAAAALASILAALIGGAAALAGGWIDTVLMVLTDLFLSLPWLFLLLAVRALLPLDISAFASVLITFALLGCLGWAAAARVVRSQVRALCASDAILLARASGSSGSRLLWRHILPHLAPILSAQFWISVPLFILTEANLGVLGLGVAEPLPSWGGLLRELQDLPSFSQPWRWAPLLLLFVTMACFHLAVQSHEAWA